MDGWARDALDASAQEAYRRLEWGKTIMTARMTARAKPGAILLATVSFALTLLAPPSANAGGACTPASPGSLDVPKSIPSPPGVAESALPIPGSGPVNDLDVHLDITHPFDSDLTIELVPPGGGPITLAEGVGMWGHHFTNTTFDDEAATSVISELPPFTGSFRPAEPLSALDGTSRTGTWKLRVTDRHSGYDGTITGWGLEIGCPDITAPTGQAITAPTKLFQKSTTFQVGWAAGTGGVVSRDVDHWEATAGAGFVAPVDFSDGIATAATFAGATPGSTYCFSERLRDNAGNESAFSALRCAAIPLNDTALDFSPGWSHKTGSGYYLGDSSQSRTRGATLTSEGITGDRFAVLATRCPKCGALKAFLDDDFLAKVSLKANKLKKRRVISLASFDELRTGELELRVASADRKVIVEGLGVARSAIQQLPEVWESAGAPEPPPLPTGVPAGAEDPIGTLITVTTNSDVSDGDTSSVANLQASPGVDDEISLREAITATNHDPGQETVHFDPSLDGETITIAPFGLPHIEGNGVFIDGDIDGDGAPDLTIADGAGLNFGLVVSSSENRLHALALKDFEVAGVYMCPAPCFPPDPGHTLANNTVAGLAISGVDQGIAEFGGGGGDEDTDEHWIDTRVVGNTIVAERGGIDFDLHHTTGDSIERTTVAGNSILIDEDGTIPSLFGVNLESGLGSDTDDNLISDALVAYNSVAGTPEAAYRVTANGVGSVPGVANVAEDVRFISNSANLEPGQQSTGGFGTHAVAVLANDDFAVSEDNVVRRIEISGNRFDGSGREAIRVIGACCAATGGAIEDVVIEDNVIQGVVRDPLSRGVGISGGWVSDDLPAAGNMVSGVTVRGNAITMESPDEVPIWHLLSGGIVVSGADGADASSVKEVVVADNRIVAELVALNVYGGFGFSPPFDGAAGNDVAGVRALGNLVVSEPTMISPELPGIKGLSVIGGTGFLDFPGWQATGNDVSCVTLRDNVIAGVLNDHFLRDNVGSGASGNSATLGGCP